MALLSIHTCSEKYSHQFLPNSVIYTSFTEAKLMHLRISFNLQETTGIIKVNKGNKGIYTGEKIFPFF